MQYNRALSPAPWTYPSHSSFFTGEWPYKLNSQWKFQLDQSVPTLARGLASQGYQTAGFVANTNCCSYETGLDRGFQHYEDYSLSPRSLLTRTVPGKWILETMLTLLRPIRSHGRGFVRQEVGHHPISLAKRDQHAPHLAGTPPIGSTFFAFVNYFDAHEPFVPPRGYERSFGIRPTSSEDFQFLFDFMGVDKKQVPQRNLFMLRDCYDDCVFYLDEQLGWLLDAMRRQGLPRTRT